MALTTMIRLARPGHWLKNAIILLPVVFAMRTGDAGAWVEAILAAVAFCAVSGGIYVVNDIFDRQRDRLHPIKKNRPIASGQMAVGAAGVESAVLIVAGLALAWRGGLILLSVVAAYVLLQLAYTLVLKHRMIVDVMCIALGFVMRAVAGAVAIRVEISPWLVVCTFTICMFLGFCKRCNEIASLGDARAAEDHRATLAGYSEALLTHLIAVSAAIAIVSFLLYATSARTVSPEHIGTVYLVYTLPAVIYGVFRFAMLSMRGHFGDPVDIFLHDWPMQLTVVVWLAATLAVLRWGASVAEYVKAGH